MLTQSIPAWERLRRTSSHEHVGLVKRRGGGTQRIVEGGFTQVEQRAKTVIDQYHLATHPFDQDRHRQSALEGKLVN